MSLFRSETRVYESRRGDSTVQVFDKGDRRELRFGNGIVQSACSLQAPETLLLEYSRAMMAAFLLCPEAEYAFHLGLGGGCLASFINRFRPTVRQRAVEINPDVIQVAYRFFGLPSSARLMVTEGDGVQYLAASRDTFDLLFVDAFRAEGAAEGVQGIPFFESLGRHLRREGWVVNNVWGSDRDHLSRILREMGAVFSCLYALPVHSHSNVILIAGNPVAAPVTALLQARAALLSERIPMDFGQWAKRLRPLPAAESAPALTLVAKA